MGVLIPRERIETRIFGLRDKKVMIDRDLAELYGLETKKLNQAVKRNRDRFPGDFMFQLTSQEKNELVTNCDRLNSLKHSPSAPYAFTELGVYMLSSVLNTDRAIKVNMQIMRTFSKMRELAQGYRDLTERIQKIERRQDVESREIWKAIRLLQSTVMK